MTNSTAADLGVVVAALYRFATFPDYESPVSYTHLTLPTICSV